MKISDVGRELIYLLADMAGLVAIVTFALLAALADAAGRLGIWLALIILPAFFRYALYLLDARANGRAAPVPGIEEFSLVDNFWAVFPAVLLGMFIWFEWYIVINY